MRHYCNPETANHPRSRTRYIAVSRAAIVVLSCLVTLTGCYNQHYHGQNGVRLTYPDDFDAADMVLPREWPESAKQEYCRGYVAGWKVFASRWRYRVGISAKDEGNWIDCRKDGSAFEQGYETGQVGASRAADIRMLGELNKQLDQGH